MHTCVGESLNPSIQNRYPSRWHPSGIPAACPPCVLILRGSPTSRAPPLSQQNLEIADLFLEAEQLYGDRLAELEAAAAAAASSPSPSEGGTAGTADDDDGGLASWDPPPRVGRAVLAGVGQDVYALDPFAAVVEDGDEVRRPGTGRDGAVAIRASHLAWRT